MREKTVEMHLSNIIKASQNDQFKAYDFFEITPGSVDEELPCGLCEESNGQGDHEEIEESSLQLVEEQIRRQMQEAERRAEEIAKKAYEEGYAQGQKDGFDYGLKSASVVKDQLERLLGEIQGLPAGIHREYRDWFVETSLAVARKVIHMELRTNPEILLQTMENILNQAEAAQNMVLWVNPKDFELLKKYTHYESWRQESPYNFSVKSSSDLKPGNCRLESDIQLIEAGIEAQFDIIREAFAENAPTDGSL